MGMDMSVHQPTLERELRTLIPRHASRWRQACWRITGDQSLAEDAVQDALLNAWRAQAQFRGEAELSTWIQRIAIRTAIDLMRKRGPMAELEPDDAVLGESAHRPERHWQQRAFSTELGQAMARLTDIERIAFVLKHQEQWRLEEIAEHLGRTMDSIKQALLRALKKLRSDLQHWQETDHD